MSTIDITTLDWQPQSDRNPADTSFDRIVADLPGDRTVSYAAESQDGIWVNLWVTDYANQQAIVAEYDPHDHASKMTWPQLDELFGDTWRRFLLDKWDALEKDYLAEDKEMDAEEGIDTPTDRYTHSRPTDLL